MSKKLPLFEEFTDEYPATSGMKSWPGPLDYAEASRGEISLDDEEYGFQGDFSQDLSNFKSMSTITSVKLVNKGREDHLPYYDLAVTTDVGDVRVGLYYLEKGGTAVEAAEAAIRGRYDKLLSYINGFK
jgi:hypothetical protein